MQKMCYIQETHPQQNDLERLKIAKQVYQANENSKRQRGGYADDIVR